MIEYITLFINEMVTLFVEMAPYITLGIVIAGVLHVILSKDFVARHIGGNNLSSVFKAALFGVPLPLCSCGVVPTAVYLKNSGASKSSVLSFLISTPQTGVDSITASWGMLGPLFALFRAAAALLIGMAGGIANFLLDRFGGKEALPSRAVTEGASCTEGSSEGDTCTDGCCSESAGKKDSYHGIFGKIRQVFDYAFFELLNDIALNFLMGVALAALISLFIPDDYFAGTFLAHPLISMLLMIVIGIPMYICSTSSIPIAVAMIAKGLSPGAAYVFLVAGPATNAASLAIISKALGRKTTLRYLGTIITGSLIFGFLMDFTYRALGTNPLAQSHAHLHGDHGPSLFRLAVALFFLAMLVLVLFRQFKSTIRARRSSEGRDGAKEDAMTKINIEGMSCHHCSANVEKALSLVEGVGKIEISLEGKYAQIDGEFDLEEAEAAIRNAGYEVVGK
ncbi:MAG: SO_0444 family Cu/Zn efflux transporter [Spirochaetales bacterium]|nr:SO_0444 family Cu/Zn efflux transporter [Spirochaetales bacterium]